MRSDNWKIEKPNMKISAKLPASPAKDYVRPEIRKVAVEIVSDEEEFIPAYAHGCNSAYLLANLTVGELDLISGSSTLIDCGFSLKVPPGYRVEIASSISGLFLSRCDSERMKVNAINVGENLTLHHKQEIARIWIEPVYIFEWVTKG